jgi:hypothetical protein
MTPIGKILAWMGPVLLLGCQTPPPPEPPPPPPPPPDADGKPDGAIRRPFTVPHEDFIDRGRGDLDDWHLYVTQERGTLRIQLTSVDGSALPNLTVAIADESGALSTEAVPAAGRPRVDLSTEVGPGAQLVWVGSEGAVSSPIEYSILAGFAPWVAPEPKAPPPPPPPAYRIHRTRVVEISRDQGDVKFLTIAGGKNAGLRPGMGGRLKDGSRILGTFEVIEVYAAGSRVRLDGRLTDPVTAQTSVEVDVPR